MRCVLITAGTAKGGVITSERLRKYMYIGSLYQTRYLVMRYTIPVL